MQKKKSFMQWNPTLVRRKIIEQFSSIVRNGFPDSNFMLTKKRIYRYNILINKLRTKIKRFKSI